MTNTYIRPGDGSADFEYRTLPLRVYVQISRRCNMTCTMCGWKDWARNKGEMPPEIFQRILDQCAENGITSMRFSSAQGEPMLNPHWGNYAEATIASGMELNINTNCTPLSEKNIAKLKQLAQTEKFTIQLSFAGYDKESYEKVYVGAGFDATSRKIKALWQAIGDLKDYSGAPVLTVRGVMYTDIERQSRDYLQSLGFYSERITLVAPDNFAGKVETVRQTGGPKPVCRILREYIGVYDDGTVTACASRDSEGVMKLGNIMESGFLEMRSSQTYKDMIAAFVKQDFENSPLCKNCDLAYG
jgi:MoaA/NifB/PqqE/SkfB family radical SAM enzyme